MHSIEKKSVPGVGAISFDTEVTVNLHIRLSSADKEADPDENSAEELDQLKAKPSNPVQFESARALYPYVQLEYLPSLQATDRLLALGVVFHRNTVPIIMIRYNWQIEFDAEDRKYLTELMDGWTNTPPERLLALFHQLESLSIGPLRATGSGVATAEALEHLMYAVLGHAGVPGQWKM
jgi:hypothetical protein